MPEEMWAEVAEVTRGWVVEAMARAAGWHLHARRDVGAAMCIADAHTIVLYRTLDHLERRRNPTGLRPTMLAWGARAGTIRSCRTGSGPSSDAGRHRCLSWHLPSPMSNAFRVTANSTDV